jgi:hypothetical protein
MDILEKMRPLKASYFSLPLKHKFGIIICLVSLVSFMLPHQAFASLANRSQAGSILVFTIGDHIEYLDALTFELSKVFERGKMRQDLNRQLELAKEVKEYLQARNSPLANYASTLIQLNNWKKIIALSNAESSFCKKYPKDKANCWGIGGSNLWYMGSNLGEGIVTMNNFLNAFPNNSKLKYSQMTFQQMNGLYKQPPKQHWIDNNVSVYNDMIHIENNL